MELKDLVGEHVLDAADFSTERLNTYGDQFEYCNVMRFRLDGVVYVAIEDPNDGYRSCMSELKVDDPRTMTNVFPAVKVIGKYLEKREPYDASEVLELVDVVTGETVVEVGTENTNDYYPRFVANFSPEAMVTNKGNIAT